MFLYIFTFGILDTRWEDKIFWTDWRQIYCDRNFFVQIFICCYPSQISDLFRIFKGFIWCIYNTICIHAIIPTGYLQNTIRRFTAVVNALTVLHAIVTATEHSWVPLNVAVFPDFPRLLYIEFLSCVLSACGSHSTKIGGITSLSGMVRGDA